MWRSHHVDDLDRHQRASGSDDAPPMVTAIVTTGPFRAQITLIG